MTQHGEPRVDVYLGPDDITKALRVDVTEGLSAVTKQLPPKWFYDEAGCELFDKITRLPEYYPTEREREILLREADAIADLSEADTLVELGSGTSDKTRALLDGLLHAGHLRRFIPFEIHEGTLRDACEAIGSEYPGIDLHGVVGDFEHNLRNIPQEGRRQIAFLGGTIGNLAPDERARFLADLSANMRPGDTLLLGTDLVKDIGRLKAAYDDSAGVTAAFNLNVLRVVNRELDANFDVDAFEHVAEFDPDNEWIEMRLRSLVDQTVTVAAIDHVFAFEEGEEMRTEISAKFRREKIEDELEVAGLNPIRYMTDAAGDFALTLAEMP